MVETHTVEIDAGRPTLICAFALPRGRYCMRPAGHEATDGRVPRHDSTQAWIDRHGDEWNLGDDGLLHTPETQPFPREYVEKKWGPLRPAAPAPACVTCGYGPDLCDASGCPGAPIPPAEGSDR